MKMRPVERRLDDLIVFNGLNVYPQQIEEFLADGEGRTANFSVLLTRKDDRDFMEILVEVSEDIFSDEMKVQKKIIEDMEHRFQRRFEMSASIRPVERGSLRNRKRVDDRRS